LRNNDDAQAFAVSAKRSSMTISSLGSAFLGGEKKKMVTPSRRDATRDVHRWQAQISRNYTW
jgi:hypothetical protein